MWCVPNHRNVQDVRMQCHADELMCMIWCTMSHTFEHSGHQQVNCCMHHVLTNIGRPLLPCCWGYSLGLFPLTMVIFHSYVKRIWGIVWIIMKIYTSYPITARNSFHFRSRSHYILTSHDGSPSRWQWAMMRLSSDQTWLAGKGTLDQWFRWMDRWMVR